MDPLVTVLLPVYNAQSTIYEAIESIINQTYKKWELLVINDGSIDDTEVIVRSLMSIDSRVKYIENEANKGLIYTLNRGLDLANGSYIARMDADDISMNTRLEKQVLFMEQHPDTVVCGTDYTPFGSRKHFSKLPICFDSEIIKLLLAKSSCFAHPTVVIRTKVLRDNNIKYDANYLHAEDYKLWIDLMDFGDFSNLEEKLLKYRVSNLQITFTGSSTQSINANKCRWLYLSKCLSGDLIKDIEKRGFNTQIVWKMKQEISNKYLIEAAYLSFNTYSFLDFLYYFLSLDAFRLGFGSFLRFMKRFFFQVNPIYKVCLL